jgi:hypothetical protein
MQTIPHLPWFNDVSNDWQIWDLMLVSDDSDSDQPKRIQRWHVIKWPSNETQFRPLELGSKIQFQSFDGWDTFMELDFGNDIITSKMQHQFDLWILLKDGMIMPDVDWANAITVRKADWATIVGQWNTTTGAYYNLWSGNFLSYALNNADTVLSATNFDVEIWDVGWVWLGLKFYTDWAHNWWIDINGNLETPLAKTHNFRSVFGADTDWDWRFIVIAWNMTLQKRDAGIWVTKDIWS